MRMLDIPVLVLCGSHQRTNGFSMVRILHFRESSESRQKAARCAICVRFEDAHGAAARAFIWRPPDPGLCLPFTRPFPQQYSSHVEHLPSPAPLPIPRPSRRVRRWRPAVFSCRSDADQQTPVDVDAVRLQRVSRQNPLPPESPPAATSAGPHVRYLRPSEASSAERRWMGR